MIEHDPRIGIDAQIDREVERRFGDVCDHLPGKIRPLRIGGRSEKIQRRHTFENSQ